MKVGVIGAGRWGKRVIDTLAKNPALTIAHIVYAGSEDTKRWLEEHHPTLPSTTESADILNNPDISVVCVATPIHTHGRLVRDALLAGKHVMIEKPLSLNAEEIVSLYALAAEKNLTLFPGYLYLFDPEFETLHTQTAQSQNLSVEMEWEKYGTFETPLTENLLVHELALAHELIGTLILEQETQNETDICDIRLRGERGVVHIHIDRTKVERKKQLTVNDGAVSTTVLFSHTDLISREWDAFLAATQHGSEGNKKRQRIDESIAAVLSSLVRS